MAFLSIPIGAGRVYAGEIRHIIIPDAPKNGRLYVYGSGDTITLKPGWQLILLTAAD